MIKTIPKKKKYKKAKWLSEEALQMAEKRREVKGRGEKERYTHLNAEFQRIARRDKKTSSSVISPKKEKKTIKWKRPEISSRKLEIPRVYSFDYVEVWSFYSCFLESFDHKWMLNFVKGFLCIY